MDFNWKTITDKNSRKGPDLTKTDNNGLLLTADVLEEIYRNKDFPKGTPKLDVSMKDSKKSRADLWAFAAIVAVRAGIEENNIACDGPGQLKPKGSPACGHIYTLEDDCKLDLTKIGLFEILTIFFSFHN